MDSLRRALSSLGIHCPARAGISAFSLVVLVCAAAALVAAFIFRWRVFMASTRYFIVLGAILLVLIWLGRLTRPK
ncbi:MAG: hypothetical protein EA402_06905 [Planctomycetota bacterium]|nr:MAG: hypothetical protein EA402_06905 [Planctomycetota bacterium]